MRTRAFWGVKVAFWMTTGGLGCAVQDSTPTAPPEAAPIESPTPETPPPQQQPPRQQPPPPESEWWRVEPEPTPITYETPACIPVRAPSGTRHAHPCSVKRFGLDGLPRDLRYLDDAGRDAGLFTFHQGRLEGGYRLRRDAEGRPVHKDFYTGEDTTPSASADWRYDDAGRPVLVTGDGYDHALYRYDALGLLTRREQYSTPEAIQLWENHVYNARGQLERLVYAAFDYCYAGPSETQPDCGRYATKTFTYHPNGQLEHEHYAQQQDTPVSSDKWFDARGRLIQESNELSESSGTTTWSHGPTGLRLTEHFSASSSGGASEWDKTWLYTEAGLPGAERLVWDFSRINDGPWAVYHVVKTTRFFYTCGGNEPLFVEQDTNEDGARDGSHTWVRDAAGNVRLELYQGSLGQDLWLGRVEYDYSCRE